MYGPTTLPVTGAAAFVVLSPGFQAAWAVMLALAILTIAVVSYNFFRLKYNERRLANSGKTIHKSDRN